MRTMVRPRAGDLHEASYNASSIVGWLLGRLTHPSSVDVKQRIDVLFPHTNRSVRFDIDGRDDPADVADVLVAALEDNDPLEAERVLTAVFESRDELPRRS